QTTHTQKWAHHAQQAQHALNQHHNTHHHETIEIMSIDVDDDELAAAPDQDTVAEPSSRSAGSDGLWSSEVTVDDHVVAKFAGDEAVEAAGVPGDEADAVEAHDAELVAPRENDAPAADIASAAPMEATPMSVEDEVAEILIEAGIDEAPESSGD
ncbi:hypothetical protein AB0O81_13650, partial [Microbacterium sp. NPDC076911]